MGRRSMSFFPIIFFYMSNFARCCVAIGSDTIVTGQALFSNQSIISKARKFELGFFSPGDSSDFYVGIWYRNISIMTVVWVANRNNPIPSSSRERSRLEMSNGTLSLQVESQTIWFVEAPTATEAVILDTGNFVLMTDNGLGFFWQSFDHPTDTWLPGAIIGYHLFSDVEARLVSWRNPNNPASGVYSLGMEPNGGTGLYITANGSHRLWRSGEFQGGSFASLTGVSNFSNFTYSSTNGSVFLTYRVFSDSVLSRIVIDSFGRMAHIVWIERRSEWVFYSVQPSDFCKQYASCGPNTVCDIAISPACSCLTGFEPRNILDWSIRDFSGGCVRRDPLHCLDGEEAEYNLVSNMRLPADPDFLAVSMRVCRYACSMNCTCGAYAYNADGGCFLFMKDLVDLESMFGNYRGGDLYVKMNYRTSRKSKKKYQVLILGLLVPITAVAFLIICAFSFRKFKRKDSLQEHQNMLLLDLDSNGPANDKFRISNGEEINDKYELPIFSFSSVATATANFSTSNRLGEGGFGPVYKGELLNGQFVAVKRLSRRSGQGLEEFRNEIEVIAKLQHRNLVGILGCCIEQDEKIIVYEYMPNKSLDFYLFEPKKQEPLNWKRRVQVIEGIAQGLLYLHHYSRLRIIHRDLKASNILLDGEMNPKISDFGMARIFGGKDMQANTKRIVGTYGYMSPEYAMEGLFSIKSDVFAFGVLLLEIISGKKNTGFYGSDCMSLLGHAWELWTKNEAIDLIDPLISDVSSFSSVVLRYIQVGLLCVQENPANRPTMLDVFAMFSNEQTELASPNHPAFTVGRTSVKARPRPEGGGNVESCSKNDLTLSLMDAR